MSKGRKKRGPYSFEFTDAIHEEDHIVITLHPEEPVIFRPKAVEAAKALVKAIHQWIAQKQKKAKE